MSSEQVDKHSSNVTTNSTKKLNKFWEISIYAVVIPLIISISLSFFNNYHKELVENEVIIEINKSKPVYWIYNRGNDERHLKHVFIILEKLGFIRGTNESNWDLLWAHDYPFRIFNNQLKNLKSYQMVNHIPGCGFITNKIDLSITDNYPYLPASFRIPQDKKHLLQYYDKNPGKLFVQKSNSHRGIAIKNLDDINFDENGETFVQEFIDKPYLIDGYKFDIGIYTVITSINPLRLYIYKGDVLFRFCPQKYYPFDPVNLDKYVVGDDYLPIWNVPSLENYYNNMGLSMKDSFDSYVRLIDNKDPNKVWNNVYEAIKLIILKKEQQIKDVVKHFGDIKHYFELVRFDFVIDKDLNVYLMEANMSPNLSSAHFPPNRLLYEQVLFNMFALIGLGQRVDPIFRRSSDKQYQVADKNLVVLPEVCSKCDDCFRVECQLCKMCFTNEMRSVLSQSYLEHQNKMDFKRIFPPSITEDMNLKDYTLKNQLLVRWYQGKCAIDSSWCD